MSLASSAAFAMGVAPLMPAWAFPQAQAVEFPGEDGMVLRSFRFVDLESPVEYFNTWLTPVQHFFVRNHMHEPSELDAGEWRLTIGGEVEKPLRLDLADLRKMEGHSVVNTLECAGNGRGLYRPQVPGIQWGKGAVGTARFSGPRLRDVLQRAGVKATGKDVMFRGLDEVPGKVPPFIRSIPLEKAMDGDTLIATHMNGSPLAKHHGFPARVLVPGWVGAASCKWITEIKVLATEFRRKFHEPRLPHAQPACATWTACESGGYPSADCAHREVGDCRAERWRQSETGTSDVVHGAAWAGEADIIKVEISTDGGVSWNPAALNHEHAHYAWRLWSYQWKPGKAGDYAIMARATDNLGRTQPTAAAWNPSGYLNNSIDQVRIYVG